MITVGWKGYNADLCECFWILLVKCLAVLTNAFEYFRCSFHCSCASVHDRWLWVIYGIPLHIPAHTQAFSNQALPSARFLSATEMLLVKLHFKLNVSAQHNLLLSWYQNTVTDNTGLVQLH